ncbi:MAG TPA: DUF1080 domain-containing protein [Planctomycetota bacterium]|jgi:hypothetical protein
MNRAKHLMAVAVFAQLCAASGILGAAESKPAELTDEEKKAGWVLLFDGVSTKGWRAIGQKEFPAKGWTVEDGCLKHAAKGGGGDIITDQPYENFELSLEWRIGKGGNSGIKYRVADEKGSAFGPEYQLLDDFNHEVGKNPLVATASLYEVLPCNENKKLNPHTEFNSTRLLVQGNHVEHWLNGVKVVEYEFGSDAWKAGVAKSKFAKTPKYAQTVKGHIALQDHGDETVFRSIKLRVLPAK